MSTAPAQRPAAALAETTPAQNPDTAPNAPEVSGAPFTPPKVETPEYIRFVQRTLRAAGRRVGDADEIELGMLIRLADDHKAAVQAAVDAQRARGVTWQRIAESIGITPQTAQQRWGQKDTR